MSFYETVLRLCEEKGVSISAACNGAGLSRSIATKWKRTPDIIPTGDTVHKLANYFNVPVSYLTGYEPPELDLEPFPEILKIARAGTKMPKEKRSELLNYARYLFPEAFDD